MMKAQEPRNRNPLPEGLLGRRAAVALRALGAGLLAFFLLLGSGWLLSHLSSRPDPLPLTSPAEAHYTDPINFPYSNCFDFATTLTLTMQNDTGDDTYPSLASDETGTTGTWIAVWASNEPTTPVFGSSDEDGLDFEIAYSRSTDNGDSWSTPTAIIQTALTDDYYDATPQVATDKQGTWIVVWSSNNEEIEAGGGEQDPIGSDMDIVFVRSEDNGETWSDPEAIDRFSPYDTGADFIPQVATDGEGNWVCVWVSNNPVVYGKYKGIDYDVIVSRSHDNGASWSTPALLNSNAQVDTGHDYCQQIATDGGGEWVVVIETTDPLAGTIGTDGDILFTKSANNGATWTPVSPVNNNAFTDTGADHQPSMTMEETGRWTVVWSSTEDLDLDGDEAGDIGTDPDILMSQTTDSGLNWTTPTAINQSAVFDTGSEDFPQVISPATDTLIAIWTSNDPLETEEGFQYLEEDKDVLYAVSSDGGTTWTVPVPVSFSMIVGGDKGIDDRARIVGDGFGDFIAAWHSTDTLGGRIGEDYDILLSHSISCYDLAENFPPGPPGPAEGCPNLNILSPLQDSYVNTTTLTVSGDYQGEPDLIDVEGTTATLNTGDSTWESDPITLGEGAHTLTATVHEAGCDDFARTVRTVVDITSPSVLIIDPVHLEEIDERYAGLWGAVYDVNPIVAITVNGTTITADTIFATQVELEPGTNTLTVRAKDAAGNWGEDSIQVIQDGIFVTITSPYDESIQTEVSITVAGYVNDPNVDGVTVNGVAATLSGKNFTATGVAVGPGANEIRAVATKGTASDSDVITVVRLACDYQAPELDPTVITPISDATDFLINSENPVQFGVEEGVIETTSTLVIHGRVLGDDHGSTFPLLGARVSINRRPEFGQTFSCDPDGTYFFRVNSGEPMVVNFDRPGYTTVQRKVSASAKGWHAMPDVVMREKELSPSGAVEIDDLGVVGEDRVLRGPIVTESGTQRQPALYIPAGTRIDLVVPDGDTPTTSTWPAGVNELTLSATEFTVGDTGPAAMPGDLPPSTSYTYAINLEIEEAAENGGYGVAFSQPVSYYVEAVLDFPAGTAVPQGFYGFYDEKWLNAPTGVVVTLLAVDDDPTSAWLKLARMDIDDDDIADSDGELLAYGITHEELNAIGEAYDGANLPKLLWRAPMNHFSCPDLNWLRLQRVNAENFLRRAAETFLDWTDFLFTKFNELDAMTGCIINPETQDVHEVIPVAGSGLSLVYSSNRTMGNQSLRNLKVKVTDSSIDVEHLNAVILKITVGGRVFETKFTKEETDLSDLVHEFSWDGLDAFGRPLQGATMANVVLEYYFDGAAYQKPGLVGDGLFADGYPFDGEGEALFEGPSRTEFAISRKYETAIGTLNAEAAVKLGGWTFDAHHSLDVDNDLLYLGDGGEKAVSLSSHSIHKYLHEISTVEDKEDHDPTFLIGRPNALEFDRHGDLYFLSSAPDSLLIKRDHHGENTLIAKTAIGGLTDYDGTTGTNQHFYGPHDLTVDREGNIYVLATRYSTDNPEQGRVYRFAPDDVYDYDAGSHPNPYPQVLTPPSAKNRITTGPEGYLYVIEDLSEFNTRKVIRRVHTTGGYVGDDETESFVGLVGDPDPGYPGIDEPWNLDLEETADKLFYQLMGFGGETDLAFSSDGTLYIVENFLDNPHGNVPRGRIIRLRTDRTVEVVVGGLYGGGIYNGDDAGMTHFIEIRHLDFDAAGNLYFLGTEGAPYVGAPTPTLAIYKVDLTENTIERIAGGVEGPVLPAFEGTAAGSARLEGGGDSVLGFDVHPKGGVYYGHYDVQDFEGVDNQHIGIIQEVRASEVMADFNYPQIDGEIRLPAPGGGAVFAFDTQGRHLRTDDLYTSKTLLRFEYDGAGLLSKAVDYYGNETRVLRDDPAGDIVIESSLDDQRTILDLDGNGLLAEVTWPGGRSEEFDYSAGGLLEAHRNASGHEAVYSYDEEGRLVSEVTPDEGEQTLEREERPQDLEWEVTHTSPGGRATGHKVGRVFDGPMLSRRTTTEPGGTVITTTTLATVRDRFRNGDSRSTAPDGTVTFTTEAADPVVGMLSPYTDFARVELPEDDLKVSSVALRRAEFVTDDAGTTTRVARLVVKSGVDLDNKPETRFEARSGDWDPDWEPDWDPAKVETLVTATTIFDGVTTRTEVVTAEDRWTTSFVNARGELIRSEAGTLYPSEFEYDAGGFMTRAIAAPGTGDQAVTEFGYTTRGLLEITTDTLGRVVTNTYDERNLLVAVDLNSTATLGFEYDINDILTTVTLPHGRIHRFGHDVMYRPTTYYPPKIGGNDMPTTATWNLDGQNERTDFADGAYLDSVYDFAGRLEQVHAYDDVHTTRTYEYEYDPETNKMIGITAPDGRTMSFDTNGPLGMQEKWIGPNATPTHTDNISAQIDYTYDERLRVESSKATGATGGDDWTATYEYDLDNLPTLTTLTRTGQTARTYGTTYDQNGLPVSTELLEGSTVLTTGTLEYDAFGRTVEARSMRGGTNALAAYEFGYDEIGRIERTTESLLGATAVEHEYHYDGRDRLGLVEKDGGAIRAYSYDSNGNRLSKYDAEAGSITYYSYDEQDRLTRTTDTLNAAEFEYEYSDRGTLKKKTDSNSGDETGYEYDALGNLLKVTLHVGEVDEAEIEYVVDGLNRRIGRKKDGVWTNKYAAGAELSATSGIVSFFSPGLMVSLKDTTGTLTGTWSLYKIVTDVRGSVRRVVNASTGAVAQEMDYDEFGNVIYDSNPGFQPLGFAGGMYDHETGLVRFGLRDYDAQVGRWTAKDPQGFGGGDNLYGYCNNDPINNLDPLGLGWLSSVLDVLGSLAGGLLSIFTGVYAYIGFGVLNSSMNVVSQHDPNSWQSDFGFTDPGGDAPWNDKGYDAAGSFGYYMAGAAVLSAVVVAKLSGINAAIRGAKGASLADDLAGAASRAKASVGPGSGPAYGTRVHTAFEAEVKALGNPALAAEQSYLNGDIVKRGTPDSVRLDVVHGPPNAPIAIYDLKTGSARLTPARIREIQSHVPGGSKIPVYEVRP